MNFLSMDNLPSKEVFFGLIAVIVLLSIMRSLGKMNASPDNDFQFSDLLMENHRASKGAVVLMGAFVATTWFFVYYTLAGKMTEGFFGLYAASWIAPVLTRLISAPAVSTSADTSTTSTTTTSSASSTGQADK